MNVRKKESVLLALFSLLFFLSIFHILFEIIRKKEEST